MITVSCECGKRFQVHEEAAGRRTSCPACGQVLTVSADEYDDVPDVYPAAPQGSSRKAVTSLVLGLLSFVLTILTGLPAIICGVLGLREIKDSGGRLGGQGMAITGIVTGSIGSLLVFPVLLLGLLLPAIQKVREAGNRMASSNNLKQIGLALHNYHDRHGTLPPAVVRDEQGRPLYSWRVLLLPYLEEDALYRQFNLKEAWDSQHNKALLARMPNVFQHPSLKHGEFTTVYQLVVGKGAIFEANPRGRVGFVDVRDGTGNTLLAVEAATAVPWTQPEDLSFDPDEPLPKIGVATSTVVNVLYADGSVRSLPKGIDDKTLRALITRAGGEDIRLP